MANKTIRLFYWKSPSGFCHILFYLQSNPQSNLGFLGQKGRIASLSFLGFMSNHQLNTTLLASSNICFKLMDVLWTSTNVSSLVSSLMEVVIWMRFPKMGSFEIVWSFHGDMVWSDAHGVLLPDHALNRQALSLILGDNLLIFFPWGYSNGDPHNGFGLHTLSLVYEFLVKRNTWLRGQIRHKERGLQWWTQTWGVSITGVRACAKGEYAGRENWRTSFGPSHCHESAAVSPSSSPNFGPHY